MLATDWSFFPSFRRSGSRSSRHAAAKLEAVESFRQFTRGEGLPAYPIEIFLEVSNVCDLKCVMCPRFSALNPDRKTALQALGPGFLATGPIADALDPLLSRALVVHAFGYGEPTIHPGFGAALEQLARYDVLLDFFTNGMHLTDDLVERLVRLSVHQVTVSFSGATREHYESVYQGGDFDRVLAGLARLHAAKRKAGAAYPRVHVNSLAFDHHMRSLDRFVALMAEHGVGRVEVTRLFEHTTVLPELAGHAADMRSPEVRAALRRAKGTARRSGVLLAVHAALLAEAAGPDGPPEAARREPAVPVAALAGIARRLPVHPPAPGGVTPIPVLDLERDSNDEIRARLAVGAGAPRDANGRLFVCLEPFKTMYVRRAGQVKACCYMDDAATALGDVMRSGGEAVWNGRGFAVVRAAIAAGEYPKTACGNCLANRQAPSRHGVDRMLDDYAAWHAAVFGRPFSRQAFADLTAASEGRAIVDRLAAARPGCLEAPGAREREMKLAALVEGVTRLEDVPPVLFEGWVDRVAGRGVAGWLWSPLYPDLRLTVSVDLDGRPMGTAVAGTYRPDLAAAGKGDGHYGFTLDLASDAAIRPGQSVAVRIGMTRCRLEGSTGVFESA